MTIHEFIKQRPYLIWYVSKEKLNQLDEESIVEHVLNYGNWRDVQEMIKILGLKETAKIFNEKSIPDKFGRQNYRPEIKNYFQLYFQKYAQYA